MVPANGICAIYRYQQFPAFVKQYGAGGSGRYQLAKQVLAANPNATFGDMYGGYVTGPGDTAAALMASLQTTTQPGAQGAFGNLVRNSPIDPRDAACTIAISRRSAASPVDALAFNGQPQATPIPNVTTAPQAVPIPNVTGSVAPTMAADTLQPFTSPANLQTVQTRPGAPTPQASPVAPQGPRAAVVQELVKAAKNPWVANNPAIFGFRQDCVGERIG